jgi:MFS family permease
MPRSFAAFESIPYRWLIGSLLSFFMAMQGQHLLRSLLAWQLTQSELALAYVNVAVAVPMFFGSLVAGAMIDRVERRRLMIVAQTVIMVNEGVVLVLMLLGILQFWQLMCVSVVLGILYPFVMPTRTAMIYGLVGRDKLGNAMALQAASLNIGRILGPALAGAFIPLSSLEVVYAGTLVLSFISTLTLLKVPPSLPEQRSGKSLLGDISHSFVYVAQHRDIMLCLLFGIIPLMLAYPMISLMVAFAEDIWNVGEAGLGQLMAMIGSGGIAGSLIVARMGDHTRRGRLMLYAAALFAIFLAMFSMSPWFIVALLLLLGANMFSNIAMTLNATIVQLLAHEEVRGRMSSLVMVSMGLTPLAVLPIAFAAERYGIDHTMFAGCVLLLAIVVIMYFTSPTLRNLDATLKARRLAESTSARASA